MRSSKGSWSARVAAAVAVCGCLAVGCARPDAPATAAGRAESAALNCQGTTDDQREVRTMVDASPFAAALRSVAPRQRCELAERDGRIVVDDAFGDGSTLHVERHAASEFTLLEARFAPPQPLDARELLQRAERAAFGAEGCDVNWQTPESDATNADGHRETVYRGETCNCQARVQHDRGGRVVSLAFRSAC